PLIPHSTHGREPIMRTLVTGTAGFIGCEVALQLLARGDTVAGIDCVNDYYDVRLKRARLERFSGLDGYTNYEFCLSDTNALTQVFRQFQPQRVIHLAA